MTAHVDLMQHNKKALMSDLTKYDVVDVQITSDKPDCDAILDHPLLDGMKKYTLELTEFSAPLDAAEVAPLGAPGGTAGNAGPASCPQTKAP